MTVVAVVACAGSEPTPEFNPLALAVNVVPAGAGDVDVAPVQTRDSGYEPGTDLVLEAIPALVLTPSEVTPRAVTTQLLEVMHFG